MVSNFDYFHPLTGFIVGPFYTQFYFKSGSPFIALRLIFMVFPGHYEKIMIKKFPFTRERVNLFLTNSDKEDFCMRLDNYSYN